MKVVTPTLITDVNLTSSTIAEPDTGEVVWVPYMSVVGDERINITTHRVYEAAVASTDDPIDGIDKTVPSWVNVRATNKYAMFDNTNSTQSNENAQLITEITPGFVNNSIAGFSIEDVNNINITLTIPGPTEVYNQDIDMRDDSKIDGWYEYFFSPIVKKSEFVVLDLPSYANATIKMTADGGDIKFGNLVVGSQLDLGITNVGANLGLTDFSRYETDDFGNTVITPGRTGKLIDYDITILDGDSSRIFNIVSSLTGIVSVWVGTEDVNDGTLSFGYYRDFQINLNHAFSSATLTIQGVV